MILSWLVRYYDSHDRKFKHRNLYLDTKLLDPTTRAAVEYICETRESGITDRRLLKYRHLFKEREFAEGELDALVKADGRFGSFVFPEHDEDESGHELSNKRVAELLTGAQQTFCKYRLP